MKKPISILAVVVILFLSMLVGLPRISASQPTTNNTFETRDLTSCPASTASNTTQTLRSRPALGRVQSSPVVGHPNSGAFEVFRMVVEKNHVTTTFTVTFAESALATNSTLSLPTDVIRAVNGSSRVIVADSNGSYGEVDNYYMGDGDAYYLGATTHYYLSAADAINTDTALKVLAGIIDVLGTIISVVTGGLAIGISIMVGWITTATAINYDAIYSNDHNPDKSLDLWTYMTIWFAFWDFDYIWTPYHCWECTLVGAYIVGAPAIYWYGGGEGGGGTHFFVW